MATAIDHGLLTQTETVFDFGCGRGDDVRRLAAAGYDASGWDPAFSPTAPKRSARVVNLGFVVNVIEDQSERAAALRSAWSLAERLLIVAARLVGERPEQAAAFGDGQLTSRSTFQKFFEQEELRHWIDGTLGVSSAAAAPGIFYVFRQPSERESFLASRFRRSLGVPRLRQADRLYDEHREVLDALAEFLDDHGRPPVGREFNRGQELEAAVGSLARALGILRRVSTRDQWAEIAAARADDLRVYVALSRFTSRPRWSDLSPTLQGDVKAFFGTYSRACASADELLYSVGDSSVIESACSTASVGKLTPSALYVHRSALDELSTALRVYEGCARVLVGDVPEANVVKLSRREAKVSYLEYPDFDRAAHPPLQRSTIVYPARLKVIYRHYAGSDNPPVLHRKEEFVGADYPGRDKFRALTRAEEVAGLFDDVSSIGNRAGWEATLASHSVAIQGHRLKRLNRS